MSEGEIERDELLERWKDGDTEAIDALLTEYLPALRAFVRARLSPTLRVRESVDDIVQSACREVLEYQGRFEHGGEVGFRRWLYMTALRKLQRRWRYHSAQKRDVLRDHHDDGELARAYGHLASPSQELSDAEGVARIERAFEELSEDQREVIGLIKVLGLSSDEAGELMDKKPGAVRAQLRRALARLAELLDT